MAPNVPLAIRAPRIARQEFGEELPEFPQLRFHGLSADSGFSRPRFQSGRLRQHRLPRIQRQELGGLQDKRQTDVEEIEATHAERLGVRRGQVLTLAEGVSPRDRHVDEDVVGEVGPDLVKRQFALFRSDYPRVSRSSTTTSPGRIRSPKIRFNRAAKSGRRRGRTAFGAVGGESRAMTLPRRLISTGSPCSTQANTPPKSCRNCLTVAVFMYNHNV